MTKVVAAGEVDLDGILEELEKHREELVITRSGEPVTRVIPIDKRRMRTLEELRGSVTFLGDIMDPCGPYDLVTSSSTKSCARRRRGPRSWMRSRGTRRPSGSPTR